MAKGRAWIDLEFDEPPDALEAVAKHEPGAIDRAEQVRDHWEAATLHAREQQGGSASSVDSALDFGNFEMGINFGFDANELFGALKIVDTFVKRAVAHEEILATEDTACTEKNNLICHWSFVI
jgi:hypothetical protein